MSMDFWDRVKLEIKKNKKTQEGLADDADIPFGTFRRWMSEKKAVPDAFQVVRIAKELGVTVEYLVLGESKQETIPPSLVDIVSILRQLTPDQLTVVEATARSLAQTSKGAPFGADHQIRHA